MKNSGKIVEYINKDDKAQKAIAFNKDQTVDMLRQKMLLLKLTDENNNLLLKDGKTFNVLKPIDMVKVIGFVD